MWTAWQVCRLNVQVPILRLPSEIRGNHLSNLVSTFDFYFYYFLKYSFLDLKILTCFFSPAQLPPFSLESLFPWGMKGMKGGHGSLEI